MEPSLLDDGEFWLPPEFLSDENFLMEKENKVFRGIDNGDAFGFWKGGGGGSKLSSPYESRPGFAALGLNSSHGSPVESLVGSAETESDEENYIAGLIRQMANSTLEDDLSGGFGGHHNFLGDDYSKGLNQSGSPQSTLCGGGVSCGCRNLSAQNCQERVPSAAWNLYCAVAEEMARTKINADPYGFNHGGRGPLGPHSKPSPVPVAAKNPNIGSGYYNQPSLPYQKLQAIQFQQLKQQQMMKHRQVMQNRGRINGANNGRSVGLYPSAWPNLQHVQNPRDGSAMQAVFLGNPTGKRGSTGTGVFLPRRITPTPSATVNRKKQTLSTVLVPARVAQALNLNLDDSAAQPQLHPQAGVSDASLRQRSNNGGMSGQKRGETRPVVPSNEIRLPSDWSY
ncbi:PREDICTED: uncharacterized protein LOC104806538 [Tarenaya hassleriana]|uniref:uncharacterized protein LOC104806538 n=1 Tax=Tarenaya hassleriana TaxID=28532 RepID=UPI00053C7D49|nr:PREDICTED: uncharacterized protein LOC104806538 [Tarenaya hassleriana]